MIALGLILFACATTGDPPATKQSVSRSAETESDDGPATCIASCIRNNMARAVAPEMIESDCEQSCSDEKEERRILFKNTPEK